MGFRTHRNPDRSTVIINTWNPFNSYNYVVKIYKTPDGKKIGVPQDDLSQKVKEILGDKDIEIRDNPPEKYMFRGKTPTDAHEGLFTVQSKDKNDGIEAMHKIYQTDCGELHTNSDLEVGETYETYKRDMKHFGYRKVSRD